MRTRKIAKKKAFGRILNDKTYVKDGREYSYHATKGWREHRATKE